MASSQFQHLFLELRFFLEKHFFQIFFCTIGKEKNLAKVWRLLSSQNSKEIRKHFKVSETRNRLRGVPFLCENNLFTKSDFTKKYTNGDNYLSVVFGYWNLFHSKCLLTYVGFRYDLAQQRLIWNLKHDELPSHMPNLVQLHRLSYIGPETQLYILPLLLVSVSSA